MSTPIAPAHRDPAMLRPQPRREGADHWTTPRCLVEALLTHVLPTTPDGVIWEPACGADHLADAMRSAGRTVLSTDIDDVFSTDFLAHPMPLDRVAAIITNSPYGPRLTPFIKRGLQYLDAGKAEQLTLLLRFDHLSAKQRASLLNRATSIVYCCWRPRWLPVDDDSKGPRFSFAWISWQANWAGKPRIIFVTRDEASKGPRARRVQQ
jgi:hypothetical protein